MAFSGLKNHRKVVSGRLQGGGEGMGVCAVNAQSRGGIGMGRGGRAHTWREEVAISGWEEALEGAARLLSKGMLNDAGMGETRRSRHKLDTESICTMDVMTMN